MLLQEMDILVQTPPALQGIEFSLLLLLEVSAPDLAALSSEVLLEFLVSGDKIMSFLNEPGL